MKLLIAPDSFKGSLSSRDAALCIQAGFQSVFPSCTSQLLPVADGGEGTIEALLDGLGGTLHSCQVLDPLCRPIEASFAVLSDGTAVIEMAKASGLPLLAEAERDPSVTSTYGTGQLIRAALDMGCTRFLIGIGGSATNDGGTGMAAALGVKFLDASGSPLPPGGAALSALHSIDISGLDPRIASAEIMVASDVDNPLCGPRGASAVYGPQKGASPSMVEQLDRALSHYGAMLDELFGRSISDTPGAGAAGGLGAGLMAFCYAKLRPGIQIIFDMLDMESKFAWADIVITGEGQVDSTSANGKLLSGIGALGKKHRKPVIAFTGCDRSDPHQLSDLGITAAIPIANGPITLEESFSNAPQLITSAAMRTARLISAGVTLNFRG